MTGNRGHHVPLPGGAIEVDTDAKDLCSRLVLGFDLFEGVRSIVEHTQLKVAAGRGHVSLPIVLQDELKITRLCHKRRAAAGLKDHYDFLNLRIAFLIF